MAGASNLREQFGDIDIYLFDLLLRERVRPGARVFDAGCGRGRNLVYLLRSGFDVTAIDEDPSAVNEVRALASRLAPALPPERIRCESIERSTAQAGSADLVISSAVLHFARNHEQFEAMLEGSWRVVAPGGLFFCRTASSTGLESLATPLGDGRYLLPDGTRRYLVSESRLDALTRGLSAELVEPIKSTVVQGMRCMATWVVRRP